jgi:hypothetical protein
VVLSEQWVPWLGSNSFINGTKLVTDCKDAPCAYPVANGVVLPGLGEVSSDVHLVAMMLVSADDTKGLHVQSKMDRNYINFPDAREAASAAERNLQAAREAEQIEREAEQAKEIARQTATDAERRKEAQRQRELVRQQCVAVFKATSKKRVVDLTVEEAQGVRACQQLGFYAAR